MLEEVSGNEDELLGSRHPLLVEQKNTFRNRDVSFYSPECNKFSFLILYSKAQARWINHLQAETDVKNAFIHTLMEMYSRFKKNIVNIWPPALGSNER